MSHADYYQNGNNSACELSTIHSQLSTIEYFTFTKLGWSFTEFLPENL
ncbi:MAG: hypothetical protein LBE12_13695 [Planctomycetaceae bacterium]|nr:hypothetical protein [Planctomycetaceae bacterium]